MALEKYLEITLESTSITVALCCVKDDVNWTGSK